MPPAKCFKCNCSVFDEIHKSGNDLKDTDLLNVPKFLKIPLQMSVERRCLNRNVKMKSAIALELA